jgi:polyisoprenoid-binding protein YceI
MRAHLAVLDLLDTVAKGIGEEFSIKRNKMSTAATRLEGTWQLNPVHSSATFSVKFVVATFRGTFDEITATIDDDVLNGSVNVASVKVKDSNLNGHLLSPDFFDAERYPAITFRSDPLMLEGEELSVDGDLTIKGVTKRVHAKGTVAGPSVDHMGSTRLGFSLETMIDRTDFGILFNAPVPGGGNALSDEVTLTVELEFMKA